MSLLWLTVRDKGLEKLKIVAGAEVFSLGIVGFKFAYKWGVPVRHLWHVDFKKAGVQRAYSQSRHALAQQYRIEAENA